MKYRLNNSDVDDSESKAKKAKPAPSVEEMATTTKAMADHLEELNTLVLPLEFERAKTLMKLTYKHRRSIMKKGSDLYKDFPFYFTETELVRDTFYQFSYFLYQKVYRKFKSDKARENNCQPHFVIKITTLLKHNTVYFQFEPCSLSIDFPFIISIFQILLFQVKKKSPKHGFLQDGITKISFLKVQQFPCMISDLSF